MRFVCSIINITEYYYWLSWTIKLLIFQKKKRFPYNLIQFYSSCTYSDEYKCSITTQFRYTPRTGVKVNRSLWQLDAKNDGISSCANDHNRSCERVIRFVLFPFFQWRRSNFVTGTRVMFTQRYSKVAERRGAAWRGADVGNSTCWVHQRTEHVCYVTNSPREAVCRKCSG